MKSQSDIISKILKNYDLCEHCTGRLASKLLGKTPSKHLGKKILMKYNKSPKKCYVCKNLYENVTPMLMNILDKSSEYNFKSFHIGIIIKPSILERDDYIKSKFKIKGIENLKFNLSRELEKKISKKTHSNRISDNPDLFIEVNFKDESCKLRAKPLVVYGRYNKNIRKLSQKEQFCVSCKGIGCHNCNFKGFINIQSIERTLSNFFIDKFDCKQVKTNWIGGEDQLSLVLGNGRPFFAKLINPKKRNTILRKTYDLKEISLSELQKMTIQPKGIVKFKSEVSIIIQTNKPLHLTHLRKLDVLKNLPILNSGRRNVRSEKFIHKINYKKIKKNQFRLDMIVDGGIPIKSFIEKSDLTPNISDLIKNQCRCLQLDFKNILVY